MYLATTTRNETNSTLFRRIEVDNQTNM